MTNRRKAGAPSAVRGELEAIAWRNGLKRRLTSEKITVKKKKGGRWLHEPET
jgi:hypothetical protein